MEQCYEIAGANVVREVFDQEVVIVNLETGNYYSLEGLAGELWTCMEARATEAQLRNVLLSRYAADESTVSGDLQEFLRDLMAEKLITRTENTPGNFSIHPASTRLPYACPQMSKFSDMQDLLLLDPIHDVDETGWPMRANGQA